MQAEPNETEATAEDLGTIDDCDGSGDTVTGILAGVGDTDWYKYSGTDSFGCSVDPSRQLTSSDPISVCKYAQCPDNDESFTCPAGSTDATSPDGRPGCCSNTGFEFGFSCGSSINSDEAVIYIRLETNTNDCVTYSLTYHY